MLESRHVIGLFMLMLLFSGVFFTLGYVMGRNQYDGQVRAASDPHMKLQNPFSSKPEPVAKRANNSTPTEAPTDTTVPPNSDCARRSSAVPSCPGPYWIRAPSGINCSTASASAS